MSNLRKIFVGMTTRYEVFQGLRTKIGHEPLNFLPERMQFNVRRWKDKYKLLPCA